MRLLHACTACYMAVIGWALIASPHADAQLLPPLPGGSLIISLTSPPNGATVSGPTQVSATVSLVGSLTVAGVQFTLDGVDLGPEDHSAPYAMSWDTGTVANGTHTLGAVARDALGLSHPSNPVSVTVFNDKTPPSVWLTAPANNSTVSGRIDITADATDNVRVVGVSFRLDGVDLGGEDTSAPFAIAWNTTSTADGSHSLTALARDAAGNQSVSSAVIVNVSNAPPPDTTPPSVTLTAPAAGTIVSGTVMVSADANDASGIAGVQFDVDGGNLGVADTVAPYSAAWDTSAVADGPHTLSATAQDTAGNTRKSAGVTVTVANNQSAVTRSEESAATYSGSGWTRRGAEVATFSGDGAASSNLAGDSATFTFTGTAIRWIGLKCSICGIAQASIDGAAPVAVDTAGTAAPGSPGLGSEPVFSASGLAPGSHRLRIAVSGTTTSTDTHIVIDAFDITGAGGGPEVTRIEDSDPAVTFSPTGSWVYLTDARATAGTAVETKIAGAIATVTFTGTEVRWLGYHFDGGGIARVYIDGAFVGEVDQYSPVEILQGETFAATGLARGTHTLTIEVTGTKRPESTNTWVLVDAFDVVP